jgi:DNA-binding NarL/FixJ family response regulator
LEVLQLLARGYENDQIADTLDISIRTVNRHLEDIRKRLGQHRRSDLVKVAVDEALGE